MARAIPASRHGWRLLFVLGACGRVDFDPLTAPVEDASADGPPVDARACLATSCPAFATFCDGFETTTAPVFPPWDDVQVMNWGGGAVDPATHAAITTSPACNDKALDVSIGGATQFVQLFESLAPRANPTYVRAMMYLPSANAPPSVDTLGVGDLTSQFLLLSVHADNSIVLSTSQAIAGASTGPVIVRDRWQCVEMSVLFAPVAGHVSVWIDGDLAIDADGPTENVGVIDELIVGLVTNGENTGVATTYFDDVAVAAQRVGCM